MKAFPTLAVVLLAIALLAAAALPASAASTIRFRFTSHTFEENTAEAVIEVWRTGDVATAVTADFLTADVTAKAGEDYAATNGNLSFAPGITSQTIRIPILNNALNEPTETFQVQLANPSADTTLGALATVTLRDNDGIKLEFTAYQSREDSGSVTLALVRGPDETVPASVNYTPAWARSGRSREATARASLPKPAGTMPNIS